MSRVNKDVTPCKIQIQILSDTKHHVRCNIGSDYAQSSPRTLCHMSEQIEGGGWMNGRPRWRGGAYPRRMILIAPRKVHTQAFWGIFGRNLCGEEILLATLFPFGPSRPSDPTYISICKYLVEDKVIKFYIWEDPPPSLPIGWWPRVSLIGLDKRLNTDG